MHETWKMLQLNTLHVLPKWINEQNSAKIVLFGYLADASQKIKATANIISLPKFGVVIL